MISVLWYQLSNTDHLCGGGGRNAPHDMCDYDIKVSLNSICTITFTFGLIPMGKAWTPLSLCVGLQHHNEWVQTPVVLLHSLSD